MGEGKGGWPDDCMSVCVLCVLARGGGDSVGSADESEGGKEGGMDDDWSVCV